MSLKMYMLSVMNDRAEGPVASVVKALLAVLSAFYSLGIRFVGFGYSSGLRKIHKAGIPVVSVGNITLGGTGKTPFTIFTADHFLSSGRKPGILTRGYGGDENKVLIEEIPDIPVYVGQDRVQSAARALADGCDVLVMDDGFQHRRLARNLDIVLVDDPTLLGNGSLFPRGVLREDLSALSRADIIVVTKSDTLAPDKKGSMLARIAELAPGKPVVFARHKAVSLSDITGAVYSPDTLRGKRTLLVSGIASPEYFASMAVSLGAEVVGRIDHGDHHAYTRTDAGAIGREAAAKGVDVVLVTRKDLVKLRKLDITGFEEKIFVLDIGTEIVEGKEKLIAGLNSVLSCNRG